MVSMTLEDSDHLHQGKPGAWVQEDLPLGLLSTSLPAIICNFYALPLSQLHFQHTKKKLWQEVIACNLSASFGHSCFLFFGQVGDLACLLGGMKIL